MAYDIYVDGEYAAPLGSASDWDAAAAWIEKHSGNRTPLRRLAELGETYQPAEAAAMLSYLLRNQKPAPDIADTLRDLHRFLRRLASTTRQDHRPPTPLVACVVRRRPSSTSS